MLLSADHLIGYGIQARDGDIGKTVDLLFDQDDWAVRYLVVKTGGWLFGREVLLYMGAVGWPDGKTNVFPVDLSREQVEHCPDISTAPPISRKNEAEMFLYYNWPTYWLPGGVGAGFPAAPVPFPPDDVKKKGDSKTGEGDPSLRSVKEITGYHIRARDGEIGHAGDLIVDDETWVILYIVIDTRNWLPGSRVIVSTRWIDSISWDSKMIEVDLPREKIRNSPPYDPAAPVNREYEDRLFDYYGRPKYWE